MPAQNGWSAYQRESGRVQNGQPINQGRASNGNRISVAKHQSGKKSVYMLFLNDRGRRLFRRKHNEEFNDKLSDHKAKMTELFEAFKALDPQKTAEFEALVHAHNSNTQLVKKCKEELSKRVREQRHNDPQNFHHIQKQHREILEQERSQTTIMNPRKLVEIFFEEDLNVFCDVQRKSAKSTLESNLCLYQGRKGNPIVTKSFQFLVISVFPITFTYKTSLNQVCCYPAEISVTVFDLVDGIVENSSKLVQFDEQWCFGENPTAEDEYTLEFHSSMIGVDKYGHQQGEYPHDVFIWLEQILTKNACAKILCDRNQFNYVYYGIKNLAAYTGINAGHTFNKIAEALISIQDYASIILDTPMRTSHQRWSDDDIKHQFLLNCLIPNSDKNLFCEFHDRAPVPQKYYCAKAHNARLIHHFFHIMKANKLHTFDFRPPVHEPCIVDLRDPNIPRVLSQPIIKRSDFRNFFNQTGGNSEPNHYLVQNYDPNGDDDSGDDDDDEDPHDPYYGNGQLVSGVFNSSLHRNEERNPNPREERNPNPPIYDSPRGPIYDNSRAPIYDSPRGPIYDNSRAPIYDNPRRTIYDNSRAPNYDNPRGPNYDNPRGPNYDNPRGPNYDNPQPRQPEAPYQNYEGPHLTRENPRQAEQDQPIMKFFFGIPDPDEYEIPVLQYTDEQEQDKCLRIAKKVGKKFYTEIYLPFE